MNAEWSVPLRFYSVNTSQELPANLGVGALYFVKAEGKIVVNHGDMIVTYGGGGTTE